MGNFQACFPLPESPSVPITRGFSCQGKSFPFLLSLKYLCGSCYGGRFFPLCFRSCCGGGLYLPLGVDLLSPFKKCIWSDNILDTWKDLNLKWNWRIGNIESHPFPLKQRDQVPSIADLGKTGSFLLTNKHRPSTSPYPQANELTANTLAGLPLLCTPCPWIQPTPNPQQTELDAVSIYKLQFLCYSQINALSGHLSLPQFISLFKLPDTSIGVVIL